MTTGETLCCRCALCCDGTVYSLVTLGPEEAAVARARGQAVVSSRGIHQQRQPCVALQGRRCSQYESRFRVCREYRCALLRAVEEGELRPEDGVLLVERAPGLVAEVLRKLRPEQARAAWRELLADLRADAGPA